MREHTHPGALVYTDEALAYRGLPYHEAVKHSVSEWVDGQAHTNGLESFWSLMKRGYHGTYHHVFAEAPGPLCRRVHGPPQRAGTRHH